MLGFLPANVVAVDANRESHHYRLRVRVDGGVKVVSRKSASIRGGYILALDPSLVFRRRGDFIPTHANELKATTAELFPFEADETCYSAGQQANGRIAYYAVKKEELDAMYVAAEAPQSVLVAPANKTALAYAVGERLNRGTVVDLATNARKFVNPGLLVTAALTTFLITAVWLGISLWSERHDERASGLKAELDRIERETEPLIAKRQAIGRMNTALAELTRFSEEEGGRAIKVLSELLLSMPRNTFIDEIEFKSGAVVISGFGNDVLAWLTDFGVESDDVKISTLPERDRFTATVTLER